MNNYEEQTQRITEELESVEWDTLTFSEFEDMFEDRDPFEFL
jgi:hypothetical protein